MKISQSDIDEIKYTLRYPKNFLVKLPIDFILKQHKKCNPSFAFDNKEDADFPDRVEKSKKYYEHYTLDPRWINYKNGERSDITKAVFNPTIISFIDNCLDIQDGRHRLIALKELGIKYAWFEINPKEYTDMKKIVSEGSNSPSKIIVFDSILKENVFTGFKILNNKEITQFLYGGSSLPKNKKLYFNQDRFHYFAGDTDKGGRWGAMEYMWFTWWLKGKIVAVAKIGQYPDDGENGASLNYLDVDSKYHRQGIAAKLTEKIFEFFKKKKWIFRTSFYSDKGLLALKPLFNKLAEKYKVDFIDRDEYHREVFKKYRQ